MPFFSLFHLMITKHVVFTVNPLLLLKSTVSLLTAIQIEGLTLHENWCTQKKCVF